MTNLTLNKEHGMLAAMYSSVANNRVKGINSVKWEMMIYMSPCKKVINV